MSAVAVETSVARPAEKVGEIHVVCSCNEDRAQCGADVAGTPWHEQATTSCVVCADLEYRPCPYCGCEVWL